MGLIPRPIPVLTRPRTPVCKHTRLFAHTHAHLQGYEEGKTFYRRYDNKYEYMVRGDPYPECQRSYLGEKARHDNAFGRGGEWGGPE